MTMRSISLASVYVAGPLTPPINRFHSLSLTSTVAFRQPSVVLSSYSRVVSNFRFNRRISLARPVVALAASGYESQKHSSAENTSKLCEGKTVTYASSSEQKWDFYVGMLCGALIVGGFLECMLTRSVAAILFDVILNVTSLTLGSYKLRILSTKGRRLAPLVAKVQAVIEGILFMRALSRLRQQESFLTTVYTLLRGVLFGTRLMICTCWNEAQSELATEQTHIVRS